MEIRLICLGKTTEKYITEGLENYEKRMKHYVKFSIVYVPHPKLKGDLSWDNIKDAEGELFKKSLKNEPYILFDEKGSEYTSISFARSIQKEFNKGGKRLNFLIGGAFGFSKEIYAGASGQLALSKLTFSHQLVRLVAMEQFYRAMTIIKGEKYHH
ncbi:MAG: 23S rRNA (pseudouridine(1915)-N(3))-methyltransferase RlmH [Flavobacteriales bacterium]|nr:23S rRNA (pseudouridine(1915)-N(3))-methyltransferase RlmH [Flavobacteriales bacterium]